MNNTEAVDMVDESSNPQIPFGEPTYTEYDGDLSTNTGPAPKRTRSKNYKCDDCGLKFWTKLEVRRHKKDHKKLAEDVKT